MHYFFTDDLRQRVFDYLTEPIEVDDAAVAKKAPVRAFGGYLVLFGIVVHVACQCCCCESLLHLFPVMLPVISVIV